MPTSPTARRIVVRESGRYDELRQGDATYPATATTARWLYGPTNEEQNHRRSSAPRSRAIAICRRTSITSSGKFRDEVRPRFGVMRGREFPDEGRLTASISTPRGRSILQQDDGRLSAHLRADGAEGDPDARRLPGRSGGEAQPRVPDPRRTPARARSIATKPWLETDILAEEVDYDGDLEPFFRQWTARYAATDEIHDAAKCSVPEGELVTARGHRGRPQSSIFGTK